MNQLEARKIANRYAKALFQAAEDKGLTAALLNDVQILKTALDGAPEAIPFLSNPLVSTGDKLSVLMTHLAQTPSVQLLKEFFELLAQNDRLGVTVGVLGELIDRIHQKQGIAKAEVVVPVSMNARLQDRLCRSIEKLYGYQRVELSVTVDPSILAGAILRVGDKMIDGSYRGKLELLRKQVG